MNKRIGWLGGLLAAQLLIVAGLLVGGVTGSDAGAERFLAFDPAAVTKFTVAEADEAVLLLREGDGDAAAWRLQSGLPADDDKANELLDKFADMAAPWPVATSSDSAERFEVTESNHQRRLTLENADEVLADFFLGTSPGYRRVHARAAGEDEIYSLDFSNYEAPADADQWLDKTLLASVGEPSSIALEGAWRLAKSEDQWLLNDAPADAEAADKLAGRFKDLRVLGAVSEEAAEDEEGGEDQATSLFILADDQGEHRLTLFHDEDGDEYSLASDRVAGRFELAGYIAEQLLVDAEDLQAQEDEDAEGGDAAAEDAAAAQAAEPSAEQAGAAPSP